MSTRIDAVLPVGGEPRVAAVAGAVCAAAGASVGLCAALAGNAPPRAAVGGLVAAVIALAVACGALAGYVIWLRQRVVGRMIALLRPYLPAAPAIPPQERLADPLRRIAVPAPQPVPEPDLLSLAGER